MCICDNGLGVNEVDFLFIIVCYVISKIYELEDLEGVIILGFCGEVLVSISLVFCFSLMFSDN